MGLDTYCGVLARGGAWLMGWGMVDVDRAGIVGYGRLARGWEW